MRGVALEIEKRNFKSLFIIFLIIACVALISSLEIFYPYNFRFVGNEEIGEIIGALGSFSRIENYKLIVVEKSKRGENKLAIYLNEENGQKLFVTILREHLSDNLDRIQVLDRTRVQRTLRWQSHERYAVSSFKFTYLLPLPFLRNDLSGMGDEAIIKGINVKSQERFETSAAEIFYVSGEFTKIGLYKEPKGRWHYPTPVFDFKTLHEGALAFVKSKKSGRVVVTVSVNSLGQFQEKKFREFVESFEPA